MPLNKTIHKVMVIGSGPIVIGQAAEFDYAGTQACRALKEEGLEVVLVNSNPATIMTDNTMADAVYMEPLTLPVIKRIILKEQPDALLATLGGQTGLTLSMQLAKEGFLQQHNVQLLGANAETINKAEDRQLFKDTMESINQPCIPSKVVTTIADSVEFAEEIGYPVVVRPAFTLGGTGGGIANDRAELEEIAETGLRMSPITQILIEKCISGWKEIEFEVIRDAAGNAITVCGMENVDPVGVHTGDSIVVAPTVSLSSKEFGMLRSAALKIIEALKIEGGCNCQFALEPNSFEYAVIEVNPRLSRSSALASKATGYPIAKVATKIAIGYNLDEIKNQITGTTYACCEPTIDYIVVKMPKFPFDKFVYASRKLGTQMKATGEVMSIGQSFEEAMMKAIRGAEISHSSFADKLCRKMTDDELITALADCNDRRIFVVYEALRRGISKDKIYDITKIDKWFLSKFTNLADMENKLSEGGFDDDMYIKAKKMGYPDSVIEQLSGKKVENSLVAGYKMVDTCAGEFAAQTPYFYSSYDEHNEAKEFIENRNSDKKTVVVFGSGPIRIGQGIEFDYACVHCVWALKEAGFEVAMVNNNPETVSTDFDTADRLYFEPLTNEDVMNILKTEKPYGVVVAFGGQTAIKLTNFLSEQGIKILGTSADAIDAAEDRERFDALLEEHNILRPKGETVMTEQEAVDVAARLTYPVLLRPSYVLGGQNMIIAYNEQDVREYMQIILSQKIENPVLVDRYLMGTELEVDAICDGEDILIPGIMEHIERAGVHSGDSIAVYPAWNLTDKFKDIIIDSSKKLAVSLNTKGLINIQYLIFENQLYVIEVNPRSSRTVPYISKVTGVPMVDLAVRAMMGEKLSNMGYGTGLYPSAPYVAVKVPVFSFEKLADVDNHLGPEMKSTGEVLGVASTREEATYKGLVAAGYNLTDKKGNVFITVKNADKPEIADVAKKFYDLGFGIYATEGTADVLENSKIPCERVSKIHEGNDVNSLTLIEQKKVNYIISTSAKGRIPTRDSVKIRRKAVEYSIPCLTSIDTANALVHSLKSRYTQDNIELVDLNNRRTQRLKLKFTKMQSNGNDYICFDGFKQKITNPEGLSIRLSDRRMGVGADGVILISPSKVADAKMRMFNLDGSEGKMSGNGIRCVGKYVYDYGIAKKETISIETLSGIKTLNCNIIDDKVSTVTVDMGKAELEPKNIPVKLDGDNVVNREVDVDGEKYSITCVSTGNPHCVIFTDNLDDVKLDEIGPKFEYSELFPERVNLEYVQVIDKHTIAMRVWERGSGETWACGTGACAAVVAATENGYVEKGIDVLVKLNVGELIIRYTDEGVFLTGDANTVFEGKVEL